MKEKKKKVGRPTNKSKTNAGKGRPSKMGAETIRLLEEGFVRGLNDKEACLYAGIVPSTLYLYCQENPDFSERKELLKDQLKMQAKFNIEEAIKDHRNTNISQWYLERKSKDEFSIAQKIEHSGEMTTKQEIQYDLSKLDTKELKALKQLLSKTEGN